MVRSMRVTLVALATLATLAAAGAARYGFYREMAAHDGGGGGGGGGGSRRVFGGRGAGAAAWGAACALLDRYWRARCSAAVLAPRWALTAAHCVTPRLAYVNYNAQRVGAAAQAHLQPVLYLYRHPGYKVVQEDAGRGADVTLLHHDVGLVRTRADMRLQRPPALAPLSALALYDAAAADIRGEEVEVLGFGRTERASVGEELFSARLRLVACERGAWFHCACGAAGAGAGVCAGDSGGPVLYRGAQLALTSMGPLECARGDTPGPPATSVFTALARYATLINSTMQAADAALHMARVAAAPPRAPPLAPLAAATLLLLAS